MDNFESISVTRMFMVNRNSCLVEMYTVLDTVVAFTSESRVYRVWCRFFLFINNVF